MARKNQNARSRKDSGNYKDKGFQSKYQRKNSSDDGNFYPVKEFELLPKNEKQDYLMKAIRQYPITVAMGCAGTGKTYCSAGTAVQLYLEGGYKKIVLARSNIPTGTSLGSFPGEIRDKLWPWLISMIEVLQLGLGKQKVEYMLEKEHIELQPLETIRGRSYNKALIIVDEAQNLNLSELKAISTRIGYGSKLILLGDPTQSDVSNGADLTRFCSAIQRNNVPLPVVNFGVDDIVRSDIVADLVKLFIKEDL